MSSYHSYPKNEKTGIRERFFYKDKGNYYEYERCSDGKVFTEEELQSKYCDENIKCADVLTHSEFLELCKILEHESDYNVSDALCNLEHEKIKRKQIDKFIERLKKI